jgi:hypothetical protein
VHVQPAYRAFQLLKMLSSSAVLVSTMNTVDIAVTRDGASGDVAVLLVNYNWAGQPIVSETVQVNVSGYACRVCVALRRLLHFSAALLACHAAAAAVAYLVACVIGLPPLSLSVRPSCPPPAPFSAWTTTTPTL